MNALDLHHTIFTHEKASDLPLRSASSFLHRAPVRDESPTSQLSGCAAYQDLIQRQPMHPNGPTSGWDLGLNLLGDPITAEEYKDFQDHQTKTKIRRLHAANIAIELLFGIWATYMTIRYFLACVHGLSDSERVCALVLGILSAVIVGLVTMSLMMPLFPRQSYAHAWRCTRSLFRACYLLLLCAGPVMNLVLVIVWHPKRFCGWDIDISWYTSAIGNCHPTPFWAWIGAAIVRLAVTWTIVFLFIFTLRLYHGIRHPSERSLQYSPYLASDPEDAKVDESHRSNATLPKYTSISTLGPLKVSPPTSQGASIHHGSSRSETQSVNVAEPPLLRHKSRMSLSTDEVSPSETRSSASSRPTHLRKTSAAWDSGRHASQTSISTASEPDEHTYGYGASLPAYPYLDLYNPSEEGVSDEAESEEASSGDEYVAMMGGYVRRMATIESLGSREGSTAHTSVRITGTTSSGAETAYLSFSSAWVNERGELMSSGSDRVYYTATSGRDCSLPSSS